MSIENVTYAFACPSLACESWRYFTSSISPGRHALVEQLQPALLRLSLWENLFIWPSLARK
jgi:hypothetical protein